METGSVQDNSADNNQQCAQQQQSFLDRITNDNTRNMTRLLWLLLLYTAELFILDNFHFRNHHICSGNSTPNYHWKSQHCLYSPSVQLIIANSCHFLLQRLHDTRRHRCQRSASPIGPGAWGLHTLVWRS